jgi:hypothetical protein
MVMEDPERGNLVPSLQLEIYQKGATKKSIEQKADCPRRRSEPMSL